MHRIRNITIILALLFLVLMAGCDAQSVDNPNVSAEPSPEPTVAVLAPEPTPVPTPAPTPEPIATPEIPIADEGGETAAGVFPSAGYCNGEGVNVRAEGNADAEIVDILGENTAVQVITLENEWYQIELNGQTAYISAPLITLGEAPRGDNTRYAKVTGRDVQTYGTPAEDDVRETKLERDSVVKVLRSINGYVHVVYDKSLQCYIKEDSVEFITQEEYESALAG